MHLEGPYAQNLLIPKTGGRYLITGKDCPPQTGRKDFERRRGNKPGYFVIVNDSEKGTILVAPGS